MSHAHQIENAEAALSFACAGNARFTIVSKSTGVRFTYRMRAKYGENDGQKGTPEIYFVSVLTGSDNDNDYSYLGIVNPLSLAFRWTAKSRIGQGAPSHRAFEFFWRHLIEGRAIHQGLEFWHEGSCGACGRTLTDPTSIERGLGPECASKAGF